MPTVYRLTDSQAPVTVSAMREALKTWASKRKGARVEFSAWSSEIHTVTVWHYDTIIVFAEFTDQCCITLDHGGYWSATTKRFINEVCGIMRKLIGAELHTYQHKNEWYTDYQTKTGTASYFWVGSVNFYI